MVGAKRDRRVCEQSLEILKIIFSPLVLAPQRIQRISTDK
jgi:hypothetical protein